MDARESPIKVNFYSEDFSVPNGENRFIIRNKRYDTWTFSLVRDGDKFIWYRCELKIEDIPIIRLKKKRKIRVTSSGKSRYYFDFEEDDL